MRQRETSWLLWPIGFGLRNRIKPYSLSKRQVSGEVHRVGRTAHVPFPRIRSRFAAAARFLFPAERAADLRTACAYVHVGDTTVASGSAEKMLRFSEVVGEDRRRKPLFHIVVERNGLVQIPVAQHV